MGRDYFDGLLEHLFARIERSGLTAWDILMRNEICLETCYDYYLHERGIANTTTEMKPHILMDMYDSFSNFLANNNDRIKELSHMPYPQYLKTPEWKTKRRFVINIYGKCQLCGRKEYHYHIHHNSYKEIPLEKITDLLVLCENCHGIHHLNVNEEAEASKRLFQMLKNRPVEIKISLPM